MLPKTIGMWTYIFLHRHPFRVFPNPWQPKTGIVSFEFLRWIMKLYKIIITTSDIFHNTIFPRAAVEYLNKIPFWPFLRTLWRRTWSEVFPWNSFNDSIVQVIWMYIIYNLIVMPIAWYNDRRPPRSVRWISCVQHFHFTSFFKPHFYKPYCKQVANANEKKNVNSSRNKLSKPKK